MYILSALGLRGFYSSRTPMENHGHPTMETTALDHKVDGGRRIIVNKMGRYAAWQDVD
jgi:hypothetical protein